MDLRLELRMLPAGEERVRRAQERGHKRDDMSLPIRELAVDRDGRHMTVWIGPVDHGGPEEELWEMDLEL